MDTRETERRRNAFSCSVVVPARNEAGTIDDVIRQVPEMGCGTEVIVVEGHSTDGTWKRLTHLQTHPPRPQLQIFQQRGVGKAAAVHQGLRRASGDLLFILDADLSVRPQDLAVFYEAALRGRGHFFNGARLARLMEPGAMPMLNRLANRWFSRVLSLLLGQQVHDTLCGTKVFFRADYEAMTIENAVSEKRDPFGDFALLLGAARLNLRIIDVPVRYWRRQYGRTNIRRWRDGARLTGLLLREAGERLHPAKGALASNPAVKCRSTNWITAGRSGA